MKNTQNKKSKIIASLVGILTGLVIGIFLAYQKFINLAMFDGLAAILVIFGLLMPVLQIFLVIKMSQGKLHPLWDSINNVFNLYKYMITSCLVLAIVGVLTLSLRNGSIEGYGIFLFFLAGGIGFILAEITENKLRVEA
jgi:hypothetical protein